MFDFLPSMRTVIGWIIVIVVLMAIVRNPVSSGHTVSHAFSSLMAFISSL